MAIVKGARRARRAVLIGFSAVFGFILMLVMPSLRGEQHGGSAFIPNVANADPVPSPDGGSAPCPGPCF